MIRAHVNRVVPDWNLLRTLYHLSYSAASETSFLKAHSALLFNYKKWLGLYVSSPIIFCLFPSHHLTDLRGRNYLLYTVTLGRSFYWTLLPNDALKVAALLDVHAWNQLQG